MDFGYQGLLRSIEFFQVKERCMPKEFTWGPDAEKSTATGRGTFFLATPQVIYWAYIFKRI